MHYKQLIKIVALSNDSTVAELQDRIRCLQERIQYLEEDLKPCYEPTRIRTDLEIDELWGHLKELEQKHFQDIPLDTNVCKPFLWNIPNVLLSGIWHACNREYPDILNPAIILYFLLTVDPGAAIGHYMAILSKLIDQDMQAVEEESKSYMSEDEDEDIDVEEEGNNVE